MTRRRIITHRRPPELCPYCYKTLNADTGATPGDRGPQPGDVGICWGCLRPLIFDQNLHRRIPTPAEATEIKGDPLVQAAIARARAERH